MRMKLVFLLGARALFCVGLATSTSALADEAPSDDSAKATWVDVTLEEDGEKVVELRSRVTGYGIRAADSRPRYELYLELLPWEPKSAVTVVLAGSLDWTILSSVLGARHVLIAEDKTASLLGAQLFVTKDGDRLELRDARFSVRVDKKNRELSMAHLRRLERSCVGHLLARLVSVP